MPAFDKTAVLMSTYNGEKYIKEQIESILAQEDVHPDIYIRDDCSTDSTMEIIRGYETSGRVKKIIPADRNLGPGRSFMTLLYCVAELNEYEYYAFADQDDIWLPQKLKVAIQKLRENKACPALYGSNRTIYENGEIKGLRFKNGLNSNLQRLIHGNGLTGCTMVFNDALARRVVSHSMPPAEIIDYRCHDTWIVLEAFVTGKFIYDPDSYILYRIHESNVFGNKKPSVRMSLDHFLNHLLKKGPKGVPRCNLCSNSAKSLLEYYPEMSDENKNILKKYAYYRSSWRDKWVLLSDKEFISATGQNPITFRIKVLINYL